MAFLNYALLCSSALEHDGLVSMLGAGIDSVQGPQMPIQLSLTFAAKFTWSDDELGTPHLIRALVRHSDGEVIGDVQATGTPVRPPGAAQDLPINQTFTIPIPLLIRRSGSYFYDLTIDGDLLRSVELRVQATLPHV